MDKRHHCSIVGTCLTFAELSKIAAKAKVDIPDGTSDYMVHGFFVRAATGDTEHKFVAHLMQKTLNRKYGSVIKTFRHAKDAAALKGLWLDACQNGDIPGPYWALMTHPCATEDIREHAFGEVHMLSHLVGASNRADIVRLQFLEAERDRLAEQLAEEKAKANRKYGEFRTQIKDLEIRLANAHLDQDELGYLRDKVKDLDRHPALLRIEKLEDENKAASLQISKLERDLVAQDHTIFALTREKHQIADELSAARLEIGSLETALKAAISPGCEEESCPIADTGVDAALCGKCIAYVGGRSSQIAHLREIVKRQGGDLLYHDGGLEDGISKLKNNLARADAVLFPMDCVSHNATRDIKKMCQQGNKPFCALSRTSVAAFLRGLDEVSVELSKKSANQPKM